MIHVRPGALLAIVSASSLLWACAGPNELRTQEGPGQTLIVLLPDADTGTVGRGSVTNSTASVDLSTARDSTVVSIGGVPSPVTAMSEAEVRRIFGAALDALPPPPNHFTLFFRFESDELTDDSRALVPEILRTVRARPGPEVTVVGHTDTTGAPAPNFELGLKRAAAVRALLVEAGLDAAVVDVTSHGEAELLVQTPDNTAEPRNRRVEISIR